MSFLRRIVFACVIVTSAIVATRCGGGSPPPTSPTPNQPTPTPTPTPSPTPTPTPAPRPNGPPRILAVTSSSPRVEADLAVTLTATVQDDETPIDQLVYTWSVTPARGTFSGNGRQVVWTSPHLQPSPDVYTFSLTVTENFTGPDGQPATNTVQSQPIAVHYNDSYGDIARIGRRFLTELFPNYSLSPAQAVQDFSDSCPGKAEENENVGENRRFFHILSGSYDIKTMALNADRTSATVTGVCVFHDIPVSGPFAGKSEKVTGTCLLTAVYENWNWYLCDSHFASLGPNVLDGLRGRVPGAKP